MASCEDVLGDLRISTVAVGRSEDSNANFSCWHRGFFSERKLVYFDIFNINKTWDIFSKGTLIETKNYKTDFDEIRHSCMDRFP